MEATAATARDFADAGDDLGDDAVREAINGAKPQAQFPFGFSMTKEGLFFETDDKGAAKVAGRFEVVAQTRDRHSQAWGILLRWHDDDSQPHQLSIARSIGKSTALLAAASIWGPPAFVRQWRATANGLEGVAEQSNDTLLILDELAQLDPRL